MATTVGVTLPKITVGVSTAFTVTMLREYLTTTLSDAVLQTYLDAALSDIERVMPSGPTSEIIEPGIGDLVMLGRPASEVISLTEGVGSSAISLAADDYELRGQTMRRLFDGTNPATAWRGRLDVAYVPDVDQAAIIRTAVALVRLDITTAPGLASQTIGTWSETYATAKPYAESRAEILASLGGGLLLA